MKPQDEIPYLLRAGPMQAVALAVFGLGGVAGMIASNGAVLVEEGYFEVTQPVPTGFVMLALAALLLAITAFIKPLRIKFEYRLYSRQRAFVVASIYMIAGIGLLIFNWVRLDISDLLLSDNPGAIAFKLTEEHGAVFYYTTMLCFFIGASFFLDMAHSRFVKAGILASISGFALGLLATTRREMLMLVFVWGLVYLLTRRNIRFVALIVVAVFGILALTVALQFRDIDIINDPMAYFLSGEFEPFRFALYLTDHWLKQGGVLYSPWAYAIPFVHFPELAESTNCTFVQDFLGNSACLGSYTITVFTAILYFGFVFPLFFYVLAVWFVKQSGYWLKLNPGAYSSFLYAFCLLRLFLFIRNGELFNSLIDNIVLFALILLFHATTGWKAVRLKAVRPLVTPRFNSGESSRVIAGEETRQDVPR